MPTIRILASSFSLTEVTEWHPREAVEEMAVEAVETAMAARVEE